METQLILTDSNQIKVYLGQALSTANRRCYSRKNGFWLISNQAVTKDNADMFGDVLAEKNLVYLEIHGKHIICQTDVCQEIKDLPKSTIEALCEDLMSNAAG